MQPGDQFRRDRDHRLPRFPGARDDRLLDTVDPPDEIAEELRNLLEHVYFRRHLDLRGIMLGFNEFQLSLNGLSVGFGIAETNQFIQRVKDVESLLYRTAERKLNRPYRERGRPREALQREFGLYISTPRPGSFAVSFRIGQASQLKLRLPDVDLAEEIIDDMFECFELFNELRTEQLQRKIPDESYYTNFIGLARSIAPDGEDIRSVGFTAVRGERERQVLLTTPKRQAPAARIQLPEPEAERRAEIRGILRYADSRQEEKGQIQLIDDQGIPHKIRVPRGLMSDIVKPMFEEDVVVTGIRRRAWIDLETIDRIE